MKFKLKATADQIELLKATASKDKNVAMQAQSAFAALMSPIIDQVLPVLGTSQALFSEFRFDEDTDPSIPVEPLLYEGVDNLSVWYATRPGGLPSNYVTAPTTEIKFSTYTLNSAIHYDNKFARKSRLDVISKYFERLIETILIKTERMAWTSLLTPLASTSYNSVPNVRRAKTAGQFTLDDLNGLITRVKQQNLSWYGGSTSTNVGKLTDLYLPLAIMEQIREMAYQPINTRVSNRIQPAGGDGDAAGVVTLPESQRAKMFTDSENQTLFNINLHEMPELGEGQLYNNLFDNVAGATTYAKPDGTSAATFTSSTDDLVIGVDTTREFAYRALSVDPDENSAFSLLPDDQFYAREDKSGWYGKVTEGRVVLGVRNLHAIVV